MHRRFGLSVAFVGALAASLVAQQPGSGQAPSSRLTFRLEANYVEVDAVVTDSKGNFVRDLAPQDFEVIENKKVQTVDLFSLVDIPIERDTRTGDRVVTPTPVVATNERDFEGRVYVLYLDSHHVPAGDTYRVKRAALRFIDEFMGANDIASVVHAQTGRVDDSQEFTSSKPALRAAVDKFVGEALGSRSVAIRDLMMARSGLDAEINASDVKDPNALERAAKARATLDGISRASSYMNGIRGRRKAVVLFSEGLDYNTEDTIGPAVSSNAAAPSNPFAENSASEAVHAEGIIEAMQHLFEVTSRANVAIYSVDPRGLASPDDKLIGMTGVQQSPGDGSARLASTAVGPVTAGVRDELRRELGSLRTVAEVTGGIALVGTNDFTAGFRRIVDDNSTYYVLGYHPPDIKHDGKFREISVRVKRPGLTVRARKGYYTAKDAAPASTPIDPTVTLLTSPMAVGGFGLRVATSTLKATASTAKVQMAIEVNGDDVTLTEKNGAFSNNIVIAYMAVDMTGQVRANGRKTMDVAVKAETKQAVAERGLRLVTEVELPAGRYQMRLAGHDPLTGRAGSVFWDVEVPDFAKGPLVMSNLALTSAGAGRTPTSFDAPSLRTLLPGPPTAARDFALEDTLAVLAEIYDNDLSRPHTVDLTATVRTDDGTQVFVTRDERSNREASPDRSAYTYVARIPLRDLVPGKYVLTVEAESRLGGEPAKREIPFSVK